MLRVTSSHKFESNVNCSTKLLRRKYLHLYSCHPRNTKRAIPYNLARKICTVVNIEPVKIQRLHQLKQFLRKRNYPDKIINDAMKNEEM